MENESYIIYENKTVNLCQHNLQLNNNIFTNEAPSSYSV